LANSEALLSHRRHESLLESTLLADMAPASVTANQRCLSGGLSGHEALTKQTCEHLQTRSAIPREAVIVKIVISTVKAVSNRGLIASCLQHYYMCCHSCMIHFCIVHHTNIVNGIAVHNVKREQSCKQVRLAQGWVSPALLSLNSTSCHKQLQSNSCCNSLP